MEKRLEIRILARGVAWLDTGSPKGLLQASEFVETLQTRQGLLIGSPDEAAWRVGLIKKEQVIENAKYAGKSQYSELLLKIVE